MASPTDIEKKSLEAHVELCAQRYLFVEQKLESVDQNVTQLKEMLDKLSEKVDSITSRRDNQLISWGIGIIAALITSMGWLITNYVLK
jgi:hypothetical protein